MRISTLLRLEIKLLGEHGHNTRHLSLPMHLRIGRIRLVIISHASINRSQHLHDLERLSMLVQHMTKRLNEPAPVRRVPPREIARYSRVPDQKVRLHRYLAHIIDLERVRVDALHQLRASTSLNKEQLGLSSERSIQLERLNYVLDFDFFIHAINNPVFAVRHNHAHKTVSIGVVRFGVPGKFK